MADVSLKASMPAGTVLNNLLHSKLLNGVPFTGKQIWETLWGTAKDEVANEMLPIWFDKVLTKNAAGQPIHRSGHTVDEDLLELRKLLYAKKHGTPSSSSEEAVVRIEMSSTSTEVQISETCAEKGFNNSWFNYAWLVFIHLGPVSGNFDNNLFSCLKKGNGPVLEDSNVKIENTGRKEQRSRKKQKTKESNAELSKALYNQFQDCSDKSFSSSGGSSAKKSSNDTVFTIDDDDEDTDAVMMSNIKQLNSTLASFNRTTNRTQKVSDLQLLISIARNDEERMKLTDDLRNLLESNF